jgi:hypothetical protein
VKTPDLVPCEEVVVKLFAATVAIALLAGPAVAAADLDGSLQSLKDAVAKKDLDSIKKLVAELRPLANEAVSAPEPKDADEKAAWKSRVDFAKSAQEYADYALYATALQSPGPMQLELFTQLEQESPKSKYLNEGYGQYLVALQQNGKAAKVIPTAEKGLTNFPDNEDLLLVLADAALAKNPDRALTLANRLTAAYNKHSKPESMSAADWEKKKNAGMGRGYWIAGVVAGSKGQYLVCDKDLRAALPLIKGNDAMMGPGLFFLGMANYNLGKMTLSKAKVLEAAKFSEEASLIQSAYTEQARHNALVMKNEAGTMR